MSCANDIPDYGEKLNKKNHIILIGAGYIGRQAVQFFEENRVKYFADNNPEKIGTTIDGVPVISVSDIPELEQNYDVVIASTQYVQEFAKQLEELGVTEFYQFTDGFRYEIEEALAPYLGKKIALYGTGEEALRVLEIIGERISYVIDDSDGENQGEDWNGYTVKNIETIKSDVDVVFVAEHFPKNYIGDALLRCIPERMYEIILWNGFQFGNRRLITNYYVNENFEAKSEKEFNYRLSANTELFSGLSKYVERINKTEQIPLFCNVEIETINKCNGVCSFCPANRNNDTRETHYMSDELFQKIILELESLNYDGKLFLYLNNEPFLDERIEMRAKFAREHLPKAKIFISSNGIALTLERFKATIPYVDDFRINNYNNELQLLPNVAKIKEYCLANPEWISKTYILMRKANEVLSTRGGDAPNRREKISYEKEYCGELYRTINIRPTGEVSLCINDALGKYTLGDVSCASIKEIWYGEKFKEMREKQKIGRKGITQCEYCDWVSVF